MKPPPPSAYVGYSRSNNIGRRIIQVPDHQTPTTLGAGARYFLLSAHYEEYYLNHTNRVASCNMGQPISAGFFRQFSDSGFPFFVCVSPWVFCFFSIIFCSVFYSAGFLFFVSFFVFVFLCAFFLNS